MIFALNINVFSEVKFNDLKRFGPFSGVYYVISQTYKALLINNRSKASQN